MNRIRPSLITFLVFPYILFSCSQPEDIFGRFEGAWKTEWEDILSGDVDDITIEEIIIFENDEDSYRNGCFLQYFTGTVKYDDWENETIIEYEVAIEGTWKLEGKNEIILRYDLNSLETEFGQSDISIDGEDVFWHFLRGDWVGLLYDGIKSESENTKINKKVNSEVSKEVNSFFKEMFLTINKDKEALTDIKIDDDLMTCNINHGFFGREATYYRVMIPEEN